MKPNQHLIKRNKSERANRLVFIYGGDDVSKIRRWLIRRIIGNEPVIANVTLTLDGPLMASKPDVLFENCNIEPKAQ